MQDWNAITWAPTKDLYQQAVDMFKRAWERTNVEDVAYIEANWLVPKNRDKMMRAWTVENLHLGNTTTCRAEGVHSTIKKDIDSKDIYMLYAWDVIQRVVRRQLKALDDQQRDQKVSSKPHHLYRIFDSVRQVVSHEALDLTFNSSTLRIGNK